MKLTTLARIAGLLLLSSVGAFAQGGRFDAVAILDNGRPAKNATIRVCQVNSTGTPCTPLASIYSNRALSSVITQPFTADSVGRFGFYATQGVTYDVQISGSGITTYNMKDVPIGPASGTSTTNLTINSDAVITAAPRMTWNAGSGTGALASGTHFISNFAPDKAVTITRIQVRADTASAGCAAASTFWVRDTTTSTNSAVVSLANAATDADSGAITFNVPAGDGLQIQYTTNGCSPYPAMAGITVQYRMQ